MVTYGEFCEAKVTDLDGEIMVDEHVVTLNVSMHYSLLVDEKICHC